MSQFRPVQLGQRPGVAPPHSDDTHVSLPVTPGGPATLSVPHFTHTSPLTVSNDRGTLSTEQLFGLAVNRPVKSPGERIVRIPGSRKRLPITEELPGPARKINPRLRHAIVLAAVFLIGMTTLLSLAPLDNGQSIAIPIFTGFSNWVEAQQANWQFQTHMEAVATQAAQHNSAMNNDPAPPALALPKSVYVAIAQQDASNAGISPDYFVRQINQESGFNPQAVSPGGAEGIAQFLPSTAAGLGIDPFNPTQALNAAAHVMAGYNNMYGGNYAMALAAYNGGSGTVQNAINSCGSANWMNCLPGETRNYIRSIMGI
jgi:transglycosylase-like protein with SLT domain